MSASDDNRDVITDMLRDQHKDSQANFAAIRSDMKDLRTELTATRLEIKTDLIAARTEMTANLVLHVADDKTQFADINQALETLKAFRWYALGGIGVLVIVMNLAVPIAQAAGL